MRAFFHKALFSVLGMLLSVPYIHAEISQKNINNIQQIIDTARQRFNIPGIQVSVLLPQQALPIDFVSGTTVRQGSTPFRFPSDHYGAGESIHYSRLDPNFPK